MRVWPVEICSAMHGKHTIRHDRSLLHVDGRLSVRAAADREGSVLGSDAEVDRDGGHEAED